MRNDNTKQQSDLKRVSFINFN